MSGGKKRGLLPDENHPPVVDKFDNLQNGFCRENGVKFAYLPIQSFRGTNDPVRNQFWIHEVED